MSHLDAPTVIRTKRDGGVLSDAAIDWVIDGYTHGRVADAQMSALLMAIFLRGMTPAEIARWTAAMVDSGERFDFTLEALLRLARQATEQLHCNAAWRMLFASEKHAPSMN